MNGRVYDPLLGRFLSPDNYVQMPDFSQNFNRYAYCFNNPLVYTDPDGEFVIIAIAVGAVVGAYIGGAAAEGWQWNPTKWEWDADTWKGIGVGAVIGAAAGYGASFLGPAVATGLQSAGFTSASATISGYTATGFVAGGAAGYGAGFSGGMLHSNGDWDYAHKSGIHGLKLGATAGSAVGLVYGLASPEGREMLKDMWNNTPEFNLEMPSYDRSTLTAGPGGASLQGGDDPYNVNVGETQTFESGMKLRYNLNDGVGVRSSAATTGYISYKGNKVRVSASVLHAEKFIDYNYVANARLRVNGKEIGFYSLQRGPEPVIINPIYNYIGSTTFSVPQTGNVSVDVYVGYWVNTGAGFFNGTYFNQTFTIGR
jgi:hypothetical protein